MGEQSCLDDPQLRPRDGSGRGASSATTARGRDRRWSPDRGDGLRGLNNLGHPATAGHRPQRQRPVFRSPVSRAVCEPDPAPAQPGATLDPLPDLREAIRDLPGWATSPTPVVRASPGSSLAGDRADPALVRGPRISLLGPIDGHDIAGMSSPCPAAELPVPSWSTSSRERPGLRTGRRG